MLAPVDAAYPQRFSHPGGPPSLPELPEGAPRRPGWPAWFAPAAAFGGLAAVTLLIAPFALLFSAADDPSKSPAFVVIATFAQNLAFLAVAWALARTRGSVRVHDFGLRSVRPWPAIGWTALAAATYFTLVIIYSQVVDLKRDTTPFELGADKGGTAIFAFVIVVALVAPIGEELFFRGFIFGSLRTKFGTFGAAALSSVFFGILHWDFATTDRLLAVVPLTLFGFALCALYAHTRSLYPAIALHALNNALAAIGFASEEDSALGIYTALAVLAAMLALCLRAPVWIDRRVARA